MEKESDFGFFSDIRSKAIAVLIGLGSMFTLIPAFFNNLEDYFGVDDVFYQVLIFKILYFFIPSLFLPYLLYRYIKGNRLLVFKFGQAFLFFVSLFLIFYILLFFEIGFVPWDYINLFFYCIVIAVAVLIFLFSCYAVCKVSTYGWGTVNRQKWHNIRIQYILIGALFVALSVIYFHEHELFSSFLKESQSTRSKDVNSLQKLNYFENLTDNYVGVRKKADSLNQQLIALYHYVSITRAVEGNPDILSSVNIKLVKNRILRNEFNSIKSNFTGIKAHFNSLGDSSINERNYIAHSDSLKRQFEAINICRDSVKLVDTVGDSLALTKVYILLAQSDHILKTAYAQEETFRDYKAWVWVRYMTNLQHRTLPFFFLLIISTFTLWIRFYYSILSVNRRFVTKKTTSSQRKDYYLSYCKDYIYVLILLILPYFKPYDKENFKYDHPLLQSHIDLTSAPNLKNSNITDLSELQKRVGQLEIATGKLKSDYIHLTGDVSELDKNIKAVNNWRAEEEEFVKRTKGGISALNSSIEQ